MPPLLDVQDLRVTYPGEHRAVDGVSFALDRGEVVGLVGESGSGKSSVALSLLRLHGPAVRVEARAMQFEGHDLSRLAAREMCDLRGRRMSMVFQEPASALNPSMRVGHQVAEVARVHGERSSAAAMERAIGAMARAGMDDPARRARAYPHELSGGLRQRVVIAMALMLDPALLIADEPTSALDVTVQARILDLLAERQRESGMTVLLITHDLGIVAELCTRALVMHRGRIVEAAPTDQLFAAPAHPYTQELLRAVPRLRRPA